MRREKLDRLDEHDSWNTLYKHPFTKHPLRLENKICASGYKIMSVPQPQNSSKGRHPMEEVTNHNGASSDESSTITNNSLKRRLDVVEESEYSSPESYPCLECDKTFSKSRALYGHMRCHTGPPRRTMGSMAEVREAASLLMLLASGKDPKNVEGKLKFYLCAMCKRVFNSRQALGGHRASHRNVKGCYAVGKGEELIIGESSRVNADINNHIGEEENIGKRLKCDVCDRVFVNAQGLGAHKRVHASLQGDGDDDLDVKFEYDLNMPPPQEDDE